MRMDIVLVRSKEGVNMVCGHRWLTIWVPGPFQQLITRKQSHTHICESPWWLISIAENVPIKWRVEKGELEMISKHSGWMSI